ncbi:MAG: hypothetical protein MUQ56_14270 [Thermoleophilia bacterium]|nr:hypothetical protein [Thermoleophilia bacterium]
MQLSDDDPIERLDAGYDVDLSQFNGVLRSKKTVFSLGDGRYGILHGIDATVTVFTRDGIRQVLEGSRDPWDGDLT